VTSHITLKTIGPSKRDIASSAYIGTQYTRIGYLSMTEFKSHNCNLHNRRLT